MNNLSAPIEIMRLEVIEFGSGTILQWRIFARTARVPSRFECVIMGSQDMDVSLWPRGADLVKFDAPAIPYFRHRRVRKPSMLRFAWNETVASNEATTTGDTPMKLPILAPASRRERSP